MKHLLVAFLAVACSAVAVLAQEIVVFKDFRSMAVISHRVQGKWTYLRVAEGEFAVRSSRILEFRKEPAGAVAPPTGPSGASSNLPARPWQPEAAPPAPPPQEPQEMDPPPQEEEPPPPEPPPDMEGKKRTDE